jgi:hypothetical protein
MSQLVTVEVMADEPDGPLCADSYDYNRLPPELRDQAMLAQGTVLTKLGGAVERVIDAGNTLRWAKETLPHGEYLPWVQQACGLKPQRAAELVRAADWVQMSGNAGTLTEMKDAETLFIISAGTTTEQVREWFMERCAAGDPPTRKEVQERRRGSTPLLKQRSLIQEAAAVLKLSAEARELAAKAEHISTRRLMDELGVEELPKGREHNTPDAVFCKNGNGWWRFPISQPTERLPVEPVDIVQHLPITLAAELMGYGQTVSLKNRLTPSYIQKRGLPVRNGWLARPSQSRGMCFLEPACA